MPSARRQIMVDAPFERVWELIGDVNRHPEWWPRVEEDIRSGLRAVIMDYGMDLRLTADQNILLCDIETAEKPAIEQALRSHGIKLREDLTQASRNNDQASAMLQIADGGASQISTILDRMKELATPVH